MENTITCQPSVQRAQQYLKTLKTYDDVQLSKIDPNDVGAAIAAQMQAARSFVPALGQLLYYQGQPFDKGMAKMMQPAFKMDLNPSSVWKCGRQVGKSLTMGAKNIILSSMIPYFSTLTVTPLFEMK